ncbi:uncharacterized protein PG998_013176 [Apiospora kogelbergensis]|uniref:uncharacterized protein n=1 Tax=Apiospora kogelbergensis TaxID=1337665 RepID=UPI00312CE3A6
MKPLHCIGAGACGSVWSIDYDGADEVLAFKREDGAKNRSLLNDYQVHHSIIRALPHCPTGIRTAFQIPQCHGFARPEEIPPLLLQRFPPDQQQPCNILTSQRIPPLGKNVRDMLCDKYCPPRFLDQIKADPRSVDCMIRPYLGRRRDPGSSGSRRSMFQSFSLRNHIVSVDQMDELGIDFETKEEYAVAMAKVLAFMHWCARIDADDIEFVLAPPPPPPSSNHTHQHQNPSPTVFDSKSLGRHYLWILDFDRCKPLTMNEEGIALAKKAFYRNDLYYPRPGRAHPEDQQLWATFKHSFLDASANIIKSGPASETETIPVHLPARLLEAIESGMAGVEKG